MSCLLDEGELPTRGGQRPHLVLTMRLTDLLDGLGTAVLDTGGCLSAAEARRLACDAAVIPMVLSSDSMPLDVGRQHRLATAALRDALAQRDKRCAFPSCDRPPRYCEAHHIREWFDWGEIKLDNMCLLCNYHHTIVHRQGWHIRLDARNHPEFIPLRPWTPLSDHSTTHSASSIPNRLGCREHISQSASFLPRAHNRITPRNFGGPRTSRAAGRAGRAARQ